MNAIIDRAAAPSSASDDCAINILIVDDEPSSLSALVNLLDDPHYRLVGARSADQALLALAEHDFALLILDARMPGISGLELARRIKQRKQSAELPIIFLSADDGRGQQVLEGYGRGAVDCLIRPVNPAILRSKVAVFAELHRSHRAIALAERTLVVEVSERLVELMGGEIGAASTLGVGSMFWVELNLAAAGQQPGAAAAAPSPQPVQARADEPLGTLLYVEDNPANLLLIRRLNARRPDIRYVTKPIKVDELIRVLRAAHCGIRLGDGPTSSWTRWTWR